MKTSIRVIEGLFHAMDAASFPLKWYREAMDGGIFLKAVHASLVQQLGPEEVAKIRASESFKVTAQTVEPAGQAH